MTKVYVHCFLDGRDTPPASGKEYVEKLEAKMKELGVGEVASVMGRYYAMDRDNRWDRVEKAYQALVNGEGVNGRVPDRRQSRLLTMRKQQTNLFFRRL